MGERIATRVTTPSTPRPVVTVAIPTYNAGPYLRGAVESVLSQTFTDWELFVSDDSSTDGSVDFLVNLMAQDGRIHYARNQSRLGLPGNFTQCATLGTGRYLTIFHQDDVMLPSNLAVKVAMLDAHPRVGMVHSNIEIIDSAGNVIGGHWDTTLKKDAVLPGHVFLANTIAQSNIVCAPSAIVRRAVFQEVGPFDARLPWTCDWDMWMRIALRCDIGVIGRPQVQWRVHHGQESSRFDASLRGLHDIDRLFRLLFKERAPHLGRERDLRLAAQGTLVRESRVRSRHAWRHGQRFEALKMRAFALLRCREYLLRQVYWALVRRLQVQR